jgi:hypothetical protein
MKMLKPLIRLIIVVSVILAVVFLYAGGYDQSLLPGFIIILCIPVLPTIYLLMEYFFVTKRQIVEIKDHVIFFKYKSGKSYSYNIEDLKGVKLYKSAGMEKGNFPYQTAEMYYHAELFTKDGKKFIITSIIEPSIEEVLSMLGSTHVETKRTIYSTIYI